MPKAGFGQAVSEQIPPRMRYPRLSVVECERMIDTLNILSAHGNFIADSMLEKIQGIDYNTDKGRAQIARVLANFYSQVGNMFYGLRNGIERENGPLMVMQQLQRVPKPEKV